jgi:hypothetical protein
MGEGHQPYPATDALEKYLVAVNGYLGRCEEALAVLPEKTELSYTYETYQKGKRDKVTVMVQRGDGTKYLGRYTIPEFEYIEKRESLRLENEIRHMSNERDRVVARIEKAKWSRTNASFPLR